MTQVQRMQGNPKVDSYGAMGKHAGIHDRDVYCDVEPRCLPVQPAPPEQISREANEIKPLGFSGYIAIDSSDVSTGARVDAQKAAPEPNGPKCEFMQIFHTVCGTTLYDGDCPKCGIRRPVDIEWRGIPALPAAQEAEQVVQHPIGDEGYSGPSLSPPMHLAIECTSRYCAYHRDIWHHYEEVISKGGI